MKLRLSWGKNGNEAIGAFRYTANVAIGNNYTFGGAGNQVIIGGSKPSGTPNADLKWEESEQYDAGLDFSFFNNALTFTVDWFKKKTNGMLKTMSVPSYLGESKPWGNVGDMENSGIEFELGYKFRKGDWAFNINANASYLKNKLINLGNDTGYESSDEVHLIGNVSRAENGQPYPFFYGYKTAGIFQNQAQVDAYVNDKGVKLQPNAQPGDVIFVDYNRDGRIDDADKTNIGKGDPDWTFGFNLGAAGRCSTSLCCGQVPSATRSSIPLAVWISVMPIFLKRLWVVGTVRAHPILCRVSPGQQPMIIIRCLTSTSRMVPMFV